MFLACEEAKNLATQTLMCLISPLPYRRRLSLALTFPIKCISTKNEYDFNKQNA